LELSHNLEERVGRVVKVILVEELIRMTMADRRLMGRERHQKIMDEVPWTVSENSHQGIILHKDPPNKATQINVEAHQDQTLDMDHLDRMDIQQNLYIMTEGHTEGGQLLL
jgi:hypothetical protein